MSGQLEKVASRESNQNTKLTTQGKTRNPVLKNLSGIFSRVKRLSGSVLRRPALVASLAVTSLLFGVRYLAVLEPLELSAYDQMMRLRPALPPDPRLLVVTITEEDLQAQKDWPLSDAVINQLLTNLEQHQPVVIGLDIFRDFPQPPGNAELSKTLQKSDRIITVCKMADLSDPGVPPPPKVPESQVGFIDIAIDSNNIVRRGLLFTGPTPFAPCTTTSSFSFRLAQRYLEKKGVQIGLDKQGYLKLGKVVFEPLLQTKGGYQKADYDGYQILLNYRSPDELARRVTLTQVLENKIEPDWVKDRIVLIGSTAPSLKDIFLTPYSSGQKRIEGIAGVEIHGQLVSQVLGSVLGNGRQLFWFWPDWGEILWIWVWSLTGAVLVRIVRRPGQMVLAEITTIIILLGISWVFFLYSGWIPVAAPVIGLISASVGMLGYNAFDDYRKRQEAEKEIEFVKGKVREQEFNLAQLQSLLREGTNITSIFEPSSLTETAALPEGTTVVFEQESEDSDNTEIYNPDDEPSIRLPPKSIHLLKGRYKKIRSLGSGGFGYTYLSEDTQLPGSPQCVVKELRPASRDAKFLEVARRLFNTEAEILQKLGKHPQIPQLLAYFEERQEFYLVQEYIQGHPLNEELKLDKKLPEGEVLDILKGVLEILLFIHEYRVIHRDIKPGNIMRREQDNKLVLIDFGAVKQIQPPEQTQKEGTIAIGSRGYAPPEQFAGNPSFASDIYALGMIGIQALTGIVPYRLERSEAQEVSWRDLATVSDELAYVLDKMIRFNPSERYQSSGEVIEILQQLGC
ncbi:MAG: CHASE2 domain-containing serine/threonine-protein kinase [Coleofasciculaceae cyanobacterium]